MGDVEYLDTWGLSTDPASDNTAKINQRIATLPSDRAITLVLGATYHVEGPIMIDNKHIIITGGGTFKAKSNSGVLLQVRNCPSFSLRGITLDGSKYAGWGVDLKNCPGFIISGSSFKDFGNANIDNVRSIYVSSGCSNGVIRDCIITNTASRALSSGISIDSNRNPADPSQNILIENNSIIDVKPATDGDGISVLQFGRNSHIIIRNNRFIRCAKRAIKAQSRYVTSESNYMEDCGDYAVIDFQDGYGRSINDQMYCLQIQPNQFIGVSSDFVTITGAYMYCSNYRDRPDADGIYLNSVSGTAAINNLFVRDCLLSGARYPFKLAPNVKLTNAAILNNKFDRFDGSYLFAGSDTGIEFTFFKLLNNWIGPQLNFWGLSSAAVLKDHHVISNSLTKGELQQM